MSRYRIILLALCAATCVLLLPASALAGTTYVVKNKAGSKVGTVSRGGNGNVWNAASVKVGYYGRTDEGAFVFRVGYDSVYTFVYPVSSTKFLVSRSSVRGRARLIAGRWVLQRKVSGEWRRKGSVTGRVTGFAAGSALYVLLWK